MQTTNAVQTEEFKHPASVNMIITLNHPVLLIGKSAPVWDNCMYLVRVIGICDLHEVFNISINIQDCNCINLHVKVHSKTLLKLLSNT